MAFDVLNDAVVVSFTVMSASVSASVTYSTGIVVVDIPEITL